MSKPTYRVERLTFDAMDPDRRRDPDADRDADVMRSSGAALARPGRPENGCLLLRRWHPLSYPR